MKTMVLVSLLASIACSKKPSDCDVAIGKGMATLTAAVKAQKADPQAEEKSLAMVPKIQAALIARCSGDHWKPDVVACFAGIASQKDARACQDKLNLEERKKLVADLREVMAGSNEPRMPPALAGHPAELSGATPVGGAAPAPVAPAGSAAAAPAGAAAPAPAAGSAAPAAPAAGSNTK